MKKLLFAAHSLDIGGIEKSLVMLVNNLQKSDYDITIALEKKQGVFLKELNPKIRVIEYMPSESKNIIIRKFINCIKRIKFIMQYKNKFDFSASFATYSIPASFMSRVASHNNCLWGHADYFTLFNGDIKEIKKFFIERDYDKFKHIVFVSESGKKSFEKIFPETRNKLVVCNNLIDGERIRKLSEESIDVNKIEDKVTFLNVGRHDETQKKLTRIIEAAKKLKEENYKFRILMVGDGPDTKLYKDEVEKNQLQNEILFLGKKQNPYPYFKISDCIILSSDYEGYPVVFLESFVLEKPIITTKVSDYKEVENKFGYVAEKTSEDIYNKMRLFLEEGFVLKEKFNYEKYNKKILEKIKKIFWKGNKND